MPSALITSTPAVAEPAQFSHFASIPQWADLVDLLFAELAPARALVLAGRLAEADAWLTGHFKQRLRAVRAAAAMGGTEHDASDAAHLLRRRIRLLQKPPLPLGEPIDWWTHLEVDAQWTAHLGYYYRFNALAREYRRTGREELAEAWLDYVEEFLDAVPWVNARLGYYPSRAMVLNDRRVCRNGECDDNGPLHWISLSAGHRVDTWIEGLTCVAPSPALTGARLRRIFASLNGEHYYCLVNNSRANTPNQHIACAFSLLNLGLALPELKNSSAAFLLGMERVRDAIGRQMPPDGGDLEQSPNYNTNLLGSIAHLADLFAAGGAPAARLEFLRAAALRRTRMLLQVCTPDLRLIDLAKSHHATGDLREKLAQHALRWGAPEVLWVATRGQEGRPPAYLNVSLPYSGYHVLRDGWSEQADQLFFKNSRRGQGHFAEDCLGLALASGGRRLLVFSGHYSYSAQGEVEARMLSYSSQTISQPTVLVDGQGQNRREAARRANPARESSDLPEFNAAELPPMRERALETPGFAYLEGLYGDGYGPALAAVEHRRRIVWVRGRGWLVLDLLCPPSEDEGAHRYAQIWPLSPDFAEEDLALDTDVGGVVATRAGGPGLQLVPLGVEADGALTLHRAEETPPRGWYVVEYGRRVPKTDVQVAWSATGPSLVATWLSALKGDTTRVTGARARRDGASLQGELGFADGAKVEFSASSEDVSVRVAGASDWREFTLSATVADERSASSPAEFSPARPIHRLGVDDVATASSSAAIA